MKKIGKLLGLVIMIFVMAGMASAKTPGSNLLQKALNKLSGYKNFKANLVYSMDNKAMDIHEKKTGVIYVKGNSYRIEMGGQTIISNGKNSWTVLKDSKEVMLTAVDTTSTSNVSPTSILSRFKNYKIHFEKKKGSRKSSIRTLILTTKKNTTFKKVTITLNVHTLLLKKFSMYDNDGNVFTYTITNLKPNLKLPAGTFKYIPKDFPGYSLEDMR